MWTVESLQCDRDRLLVMTCTLTHSIHPTFILPARPSTRFNPLCRFHERSCEFLILIFVGVYLRRDKVSKTLRIMFSGSLQYYITHYHTRSITSVVTNSHSSIGGRGYVSCSLDFQVPDTGIQYVVRGGISFMFDVVRPSNCH